MRRVASLLPVPIVLAAACNSGEQANSGLTEPLQISGGQFIPGPLPGVAPPNTDAGNDAGTAAAGDAGIASSMPGVTQVQDRNNVIISGESGFGLTGYLTQDAVAVGVRFADMGTGYWVVPAGGVDPTMDNQHTFSLSASFNPGDRPGNHPLLFVAIDGDGNAGTQYPLTVCIDSRVPDNGHACYPTDAVPQAVFTLTWDRGFDVDLHVITPDGQDVNPKTDLIAGDAGSITTPAAFSAANHIDRDSWGNCASDGWFEEDLIFQTAPPPGLYEVLADPFSSCGQAAVRFTFTLYQAGRDGNLHSTYSQSGQLLASQVTAGQSPGLFLYQAPF